MTEGPERQPEATPAACRAMCEVNTSSFRLGKQGGASSRPPVMLFGRTRSRSEYRLFDAPRDMTQVSPSNSRHTSHLLTTMHAYVYELGNSCVLSPPSALVAHPDALGSAGACALWFC